jgi:hypothetical protein
LAGSSGVFLLPIGRVDALSRHGVQADAHGRQYPAVRGPSDRTVALLPDPCVVPRGRCECLEQLAAGRYLGLSHKLVCGTVLGRMDPD